MTNGKKSKSKLGDDISSAQRRQQLFHQIPKFMLHQFRTESTIENLFCLLLRIQWSNLISHLSGSWTFTLPPCSKLQKVFSREIESISLILSCTCEKISQIEDFLPLFVPRYLQFTNFRQNTFDNSSIVTDLLDVFCWKDGNKFNFKFYQKVFFQLSSNLFVYFQNWDWTAENHSGKFKNANKYQNKVLSFVYLRILCWKKNCTRKKIIKDAIEICWI